MVDPSLAVGDRDHRLGRRLGAGRHDRDRHGRVRVRHRTGGPGHARHLRPRGPRLPPARGPGPGRQARLRGPAGRGAAVGAPLSTTDRAALGNIRGALPDLDAWAAPLDGLARDETAPGEPPDIAALRRVTFDAWGAAMADLEVGDERLDRLTVSARLASEEDPAARRRLFLAMEPGGRAG